MSDSMTSTVQRPGFLLALAGFAAIPAIAVAQAPVVAPTVPHSAFYLGVGATARAADFGTQDVYAVGTSDVFRNGVRTSSGSASGPGSVGMGTEIGVSPVVQLGYFQRIPDSPWLWGANLNYTYMNASRTVSNARIPQAGTNTPVSTGIPEPFVGNAIVHAYQTELTHQIALMPFIGYAFDAGGFVYLGAGPTLSRMRTSLNGLVGFARPEGTPTDVSGAPQNFGTEGWVWGGGAMLGVTLFFDASWFLDVRYMLNVTENQTGNYSSTFTNPNAANGSVTSGTLVGSSSGRTVTQGVVLTINRAF
jgi:hypothetical protein